MAGLGSGELVTIALIVLLVILVAKFMWITAGWAAAGGFARSLIGFLVFWVLTTIIGAIVFLALVSRRRRQLAREAVSG